MQPISKILKNFEFYYFMYLFITPMITVCILAKYYSVSRKSHVKQSNQLRIHVCIWAVGCLYTMIWVVFCMFDIVQFGSWMYVDLKAIFRPVRNSMFLAFYFFTTVSGTFLLIDRVQALLMSSEKRRKYTQRASVIVFSGMILFAFSFILWDNFTNPATSPSCIFLCRIVNSVRLLFVIKIFVACCNLCIGSTFVTLYIRYYAKSSFKSEKRRNYIVLGIFATDIVFSIIPSVVHVIFANAIIFNTGITTGDVCSFCHYLDGLTTSLVYYKSMRGSSSVSPSSVGTGSNVNSQQPSKRYQLPPRNSGASRPPSRTGSRADVQIEDLYPQPQGKCNQLPPLGVNSDVRPVSRAESLGLGANFM